MQWLSKVLKTPIGAKFINVSKNYSTNSLPGVIPKSFKMRFKHVESFHIKKYFIQVTKYSGLWRIHLQLLKN